MGNKAVHGLAVSVIVLIARGVCREKQREKKSSVCFIPRACERRKSEYTLVNAQMASLSLCNTTCLNRLAAHLHFQILALAASAQVDKNIH